MRICIWKGTPFSWW